MIRKGKYGKLFERLKTAEILSFITLYESETRATLIEDANRKARHEIHQESTEALEQLDLVSLIDSIKPTPEAKGKGIGSQLRERWESKR